MNMAGGASRGLGLSPQAEKAIQKLENIKKDPLGEVNSGTNHNHYSAARIEAQGTPVKINPKTKKGYSHIRDLQEAYLGLDDVREKLEHEMDHLPTTTTDRGLDVLIDRHSEVQQMQSRLKGFLSGIGYGKFPPFHSF